MIHPSGKFWFLGNWSTSTAFLFVSRSSCMGQQNTTRSFLILPFLKRNYARTGELSFSLLTVANLLLLVACLLSSFCSFYLLAFSLHISFFPSILFSFYIILFLSYFLFPGFLFCFVSFFFLVIVPLSQSFVCLFVCLSPPQSWFVSSLEGQAWDN